MLRRYLTSLLVVVGITAGFVAFAPGVDALDIECQSDNAGQCDMLKGGDLKKGIWPIISFVLGILGGIAVIVIIIAGIMYAISSGDSSRITMAKNMIMYAVVGLIVAMLAAVIISFVNGFFK